MALWQAVSDRYDQLVAAWDSGRADARPGSGCRRCSAGGSTRGALSGAGLAVSIVDACRLSDALAAQLRARLSFDPRAADAAARVAALRAGMERLRELAKAGARLGSASSSGSPPGSTTSAGPRQRGADVSVPLDAPRGGRRPRRAGPHRHHRDRGHRARERQDAAAQAAARAAATAPPAPRPSGWPPSGPPPTSPRTGCAR